MEQLVWLCKAWMCSFMDNFSPLSLFLLYLSSTVSAAESGECNRTQAGTLWVWNYVWADLLSILMELCWMCPDHGKAQSRQRCLSAGPGLAASDSSQALLWCLKSPKLKWLPWFAFYWREKSPFLTLLLKRFSIFLSTLWNQAWWCNSSDQDDLHFAKLFAM